MIKWKKKSDCIPKYEGHLIKIHHLTDLSTWNYSWVIYKHVNVCLCVCSQYKSEWMEEDSSRFQSFREVFESSWCHIVSWQNFLLCVFLSSCHPHPPFSQSGCHPFSGCPLWGLVSFHSRGLNQTCLRNRGHIFNLFGAPLMIQGPHTSTQLAHTSGRCCSFVCPEPDERVFHSFNTSVTSYTSMNGAPWSWCQSALQWQRHTSSSESSGSHQACKQGLSYQPVQQVRVGAQQRVAVWSLTEGN